MAVKKYLNLNGLATFFNKLKVLFATKDEVNAKADLSHTHNDTYYTETEVDTFLSSKANSTHKHSISDITNLQSSLDGKQATITGGATTIASSNLTASRALISNSSGKVAVSAITSTELGYLDGVTSNVQTQLDGKSASGHTHNYAGSSSAGGAATSANKLNTNAGSATQPVYFSNGVPVATTYTLGKSVPSNAVFTDTHYSSKNVVGATNATSNTATALTNGNVYINSVENGAVTSSHKISGAGATTVTTDANGNIVISSTDNNTTYSVATTSANGLMSSSDKSKLDGMVLATVSEVETYLGI